jgi:hypothetical protein
VTRLAKAEAEDLLDWLEGNQQAATTVRYAAGKGFTVEYPV